MAFCEGDICQMCYKISTVLRMRGNICETIPDTHSPLSLMTLSDLWGSFQPLETYEALVSNKIQHICSYIYDATIINYDATLLISQHFWVRIVVSVLYKTILYFVFQCLWFSTTMALYKFTYLLTYLLLRTVTNCYKCLPVNGTCP